MATATDGLVPTFVFIDESGNYDFSRKGTKFFVLTALLTSDPVISGGKLQQLKYQLLSQEAEEFEFHASNNRQITRDLVCNQISSLSGIHSATFTLEKKILELGFQTDEHMLAYVSKACAQWIADKVARGDFKVIVVFDAALPSRLQKAFKSAVKPLLKAQGVQYRIVFHRVLNDFNSQIADYIAWSHFRNVERGDIRALEALGAFSGEVFCLKK